MNKDKAVFQGRTSRMEINKESNKSGRFDSADMITNNVETTSKFIKSNGPDDVELDELNLEEIKKRWSALTIHEIMDTEGELSGDSRNNNMVQIMDVVLSNADCAESPSNYLAKLVVQASHPQ